MNLDEAYRDKIGERLTLRLAQALEDKEITAEVFSSISSYILENIYKVQSNLELVDFLEALSQKWSIFANTLEIEKGEIKNKNEEVIADQASGLIRENKIEEAIKVVESATASDVVPNPSSIQGGQV